MGSDLVVLVCVEEGAADRVGAWVESEAAPAVEGKHLRDAAEMPPRSGRDLAEVWPLPHLESLAAHLWVPHAVVEVDLGVELRAELGENLRDIAEISPRYRRDAAVMPP